MKTKDMRSKMRLVHSTSNPSSTNLPALEKATSSEMPPAMPFQPLTTSDHALNDLKTHFKELTHVQAKLKFLLGELEEFL